MANRSELLINVVIDSKLKVLTSLTKRYVVGSGVRSSPDADENDHRRRGRAYPMHGTDAERGKPIMPLETGKPLARETDGMVGKG
jgi:hypothetical protein